MAKKKDRAEKNQKIPKETEPEARTEEPEGFTEELFSRFGENKFFIFAGAGAVLLSVGVIYIVSILSSTGILTMLLAAASSESAAAKTAGWHDSSFWTMLALAIVGAVTTVLAFMLRKDDTGADKDIRQYDYALLGLGFALTLVGVVNFIALAGFSSVGVLHSILSINADSCDPKDGRTPAACSIYQMVQLCLIPGFAILGSLFFVAGSLRVKRDQLEKGETAKDDAVDAEEKNDENLEYRSTKFWGGLWYRVGEAVLFALVIYIVMTVDGPQDGKPGEPGPYSAGLVWILALSLIVGMFIKPAEVLINGVGTRLLKAVEALIKS
jgi:hypothetical protein